MPARKAREDAARPPIFCVSRGGLCIVGPGDDVYAAGLGEGGLSRVLTISIARYEAREVRRCGWIGEYFWSRCMRICFCLFIMWLIPFFLVLAKEFGRCDGSVSLNVSLRKEM